MKSNPNAEVANSSDNPTGARDDADRVLEAGLFASSDLVLLARGGDSLPIIGGGSMAPTMPYGLNGAVKHLAGLACRLLTSCYELNNGAEDLALNAAALRVCRASLDTIEEALICAARESFEWHQSELAKCEAFERELQQVETQKSEGGE